MSSQQRRHEPWRNDERHYCAVCNAWMGGDRQSILLHENGKKHKENWDASLQQRRQDKTDGDKAQKLLQSSLQAMERAAAAALAQDATYGSYIPPPPPIAAAVAPPNVSTTAVASGKSVAAKQEKQAWESRKKKREQEHSRKDDPDLDQEPTTKKQRKKRLAADEGHYIHGDTTYLEGPSFAELLEEDMPIQIWTGSGFASLAEKRLQEKSFQWRNGLVIAVRKSSQDPSGIVLDVAYLMQAADTEETLEKSVSPARIRIVLGADDSIPDTLDEARLAVMGEEVTEVQDPTLLEVDENTGLSGWGTVSIRKTTVRTELKDERERVRAKRREQMELAEKEQKEGEARKMEEAKVENGEDSALGAYDVWSNGSKGYKGVDINQEVKLDVQDTAKSLSRGKGAVEFKNSRSTKFQKSKKKLNRRTTSADDD